MRTPMWTRVAAAATLLLSLSAACGGGGDDETVRVYTGRHYGVESAFRQFSKDTGIKVQFLSGSDADLRERLKSEGEDTLADVYLTVDVANLSLATGAGLLRPLKSKSLEATVPAQYRDPEGRWFALALRARTIIFNPDKVQESELSTYEALADPKWKGRLCLRNSTASYTQSLVASLIANDGEDEARKVLDGWVANKPTYINADPEIVRTVAAGKCDVAIVNHYYLAQELAKDPDLNVKIFWAEQATRGVHVNVSGAGVTKHADDPELAQKFIEWLAGEGQHVFVESSDEYPVNPDTKPNKILEAFGDFKADKLDATEIGDLNAEAVDLMDEAGYK